MTKTISRSVLGFTLLLLASSAMAGAPAAPPSATTSVQTAPSLAEQMQATRKVAIERLTAYRKRGEFASDAKGFPMSVFRDDKGRRCPMAELIFQSGHGDLVDAVVKQNNTLRLLSVTKGPIAEWMATSGLTREEIIEIQGLARMPMPQLKITPELAHELMINRLQQMEKKLASQTKASLQKIVAVLNAQPATKVAAK
jgi:hypothetical protein